MAKAFGGMGGGGGAAPPRPMPNPFIAGGAAPAAAAPAAPKPAGFGLFPNMPVQQRYDMAMELLKNGAQMAADSGSPVAAFLAPLAQAGIGGSIANKFEGIKSAEEDSLMAAMMPGGVSPKIKELAAIVENPNTPDYLKKVAQAQLDAELKPLMPGKGGGGGGKKGGGKGRPSSTDVLLSSILGEALDPNGEGGDTITPAEQAKIDAITAARGKKPPKVDEAAPVVPGEPVVIDGYTIEALD